MLNALLRM